MTGRRTQEGSLRPDRLEFSRLFWAIGISLAVHLLCYGGYKAGKKLGVWQALKLPAWVEKVRQLTSMVEPAKQPQEPREAPLMFVDVNPQAAIAEPPKNAKFYSDKNSEAANPDMDRESEVPKLTGKQTDVVKAEDVNRSRFEPLQPAFPRAEQEQQPEQVKPRTQQPVGDLSMAKPETETRTGQGTAEQARPRTVQEAKARQNRNQLVGQKMKQEGGVNRMRVTPSFDTKATALGNYDQAMIEAISQRWFDLLDARNFSWDRYGKVVITFRQHQDGTVTNVEILENTVDERLHGMYGFICQQAVTQPAPFQRWPAEVRRMLDKDYL
ncbi:MAG: hypothetical protein H7Y43_14030, partial [Akkermansiaceae bacterium]|nr:hypothetical protein [Verrucomicrobiales bacterium]